MNECTYKNYGELPLMLNVVQVAAVLGISRAGAYELVHGEGFPTAGGQDRPVSGRSRTARAAGGLLSGTDHRPAAGRAPRPAVDRLGCGEHDHLCQQTGEPHQRRTGGQPAQDAQLHPSLSGAFLTSRLLGHGFGHAKNAKIPRHF